MNIDEGVIECQIPGDFWSWDLNMCVLGTFYPGACCDDVTSGCESYTEYVDCPPPLRFTPGVLCGEMDLAVRRHHRRLLHGRDVHGDDAT